MAKRKYTIGVDFGTESGRAVLVDVANGDELATAIYPYSHGVIDETLPVGGKTVRLEPDWALQDPEDYIRTFKHTIPDVLRLSSVDPADVIGIGIDFTACTMLPALDDGTPLCMLPEYRRNPHAWVKLWKHHAAQPEADKINATARELGEPWLDRYGSKISSEWFFSKTLQILEEAPEIYAAADRLIEGADWVVWQLTGEETRNSCTAGYKAMWSKREGFPQDTYFAALDPRLEHEGEDSREHLDARWYAEDRAQVAHDLVHVPGRAIAAAEHDEADAPLEEGAACVPGVRGGGHGPSRRREDHLDGRPGGDAQQLVDLRRVAMPADVVRRHALVALRVMRGQTRGPAGAGNPGLRVDDDPLRLDQPRL